MCFVAALQRTSVKPTHVQLEAHAGVLGVKISQVTTREEQIRAKRFGDLDDQVAADLSLGAQVERKGAGRDGLAI